LSEEDDVAARLTSEGQVTTFRVEGRRAVLAHAADLLDLAGTVSVPASKRRASWEEVRRQVRSASKQREPPRS
jgi:hypothetical protein